MAAQAIDALARGETVQSMPQKVQQYKQTAPTEDDFRRLKEAGFRVWDRDDLLPILERYV